MARTEVTSLLLTLVRHGQTEANRQLIVQGQKDVCLSDEGRLQAKKLATHVQAMGLSFDAIYSSDLVRAKETAEIIAGPEKKDAIFVDSRLRERGYGVFEGQSLLSLREAAKEAGFNDKNYSSFLPEGAESLEDVHVRIQDFCHRQLLLDCDCDDGRPVTVRPLSCPGASCTPVVSVSPCPPKNILLVTHGGVIREFMRFFRNSLKCQLPPEAREPIRVTPNTGVNVFRIFFQMNKANGKALLADATLSFSQGCLVDKEALLDGEPSTATLLRAECIKVHDTCHLEVDAKDPYNIYLATLPEHSNNSTSGSSNNNNETGLRPDLHLV